MSSSRRPQSDQNRAETDGPILVVEDEPEVLWLIRQLLEDQGYRVEAVMDDEQATDQAAERCPALVILDIELPGVGGENVAAKLRARCGRDVPILIVSALGRSTQQVRKVHATYYLPKPFDVDDFLRVIEQMLAQNQARRQDSGPG